MDTYVRIATSRPFIAASLTDAIQLCYNVTWFLRKSDEKRYAK